LKSPNWHRDEIILALDLYFSLEPKEMDSNNEQVIALSRFLNKLPIYSRINTSNKFRNPNGVSLKLNNFKAIDPDYTGKGMNRYSKLDKEVFFEFREHKQILKSISNKIKNAVSDEAILSKLYSSQNNEGCDVKEGQIIFRLHKLRERNQKIVRIKKDHYFKKNNKLDCEICGFDFYDKYGELGIGFIEVHHRIPLADLYSEMRVELKDLALVCSNCHRILHRGKMDNISVQKLKDYIKKPVK
jgi:5-methylcytosine-specific restriction enzyme A